MRSCGIRQHLWPQLKSSEGRCRSWHCLAALFGVSDLFLECKLKQRENTWGQILLLGWWALNQLALALRGEGERLCEVGCGAWEPPMSPL